MCPIVPSGGWVDGPITFETEGVWAREAREARTQSATLVEPMRLHAVARESRARPTLSALTHADVCTTNQSVNSCLSTAHARTRNVTLMTN
jgi:hypothetical protein